MNKKVRGISAQIALLVLMVAATMFAVSTVIALFNAKDAAYDSASANAIENLQVPYNLAESFYKRANNGEMSQEEAYKRFVAVIDEFRFGKENHNYVVAVSTDGKVVSHRVKEYVGKDASEIKGLGGKPYIADMMKIANKDGKNYEFITYQTAHILKNNEPDTRVGSARLFEPWGIIVATGNYISEYQGDVISDLIKSIMINLLILAAIVLVSYFGFAKRIATRLGTMADTLSSNSFAVSEASTQLNGSNARLAEGASEQAASLQETSSTLEETNSMIRNNAENAIQMSNMTGKTAQAIIICLSEMKNMVDAMGEINNSSTEISKIIKVIEEIAFQTNILALNAAVEAARAGEAGKGFSVVAEEVRNLAQRCTQAANDTSELISTNIRLAHDGVKVANNVYEELERVNEGASAISKIVNEVSEATKEQSRGVNEISQAVVQMEEVVQINTRVANESADASQRLSHQAEIMSTVVNELNLIVNGGTSAGNDFKKLQGPTESYQLTDKMM